LATGAIDFSAGTYKAVLVTVAPTETELDTWDFRNDITNECTDADYTAGGFNCTCTVGAVNAATDSVDITIDGTASLRIAQLLYLL